MTTALDSLAPPLLLRRFFALAIVATLLPGGVLPLAAQEQSEPRQTAEQMPDARIRVDVNLVLLEATVKDKSGRVMGDLRKEDFLLDDDGLSQQIAHFSRDQLPLAVALVVDLSGSIQPFLRPLRYASMSALKALKPEDEVALFTFSSGVERRVALTRERREVSDQIEFFTAAGGTNINGAIYQAALYLREEAPAARRVIVLVSDNVPTEKGGVSSQEVLDTALQGDAAVYSLKVPGRNPWEAKLAAKAQGMVNVGKLTAETGGEVFEVEKEGSLFLAFQALIERLKTRYTIGFYPARKAEDGAFHRLNLRLQPTLGSKGRDYSVLSKNGYYAARPRRAGR